MLIFFLNALVLFINIALIIANIAAFFISKKLLLDILKENKQKEIKQILLSANGILIKNRGDKMYQLQDANDMVTYAIAKEIDAAGNEVQATPDMPPVWSISDESLATIEASADGETAVIKPKGPLGMLQVQVSAIYAGKAILGTDMIQIIPSAVTSIVIAPVIPEAKK